MIKSLIYEIKEHKNFQNILQVQIDEIEKKMSKTIKKIKRKTNSKPHNFEKTIISHINIFFKRTSRNFQNSLKSLILPIKHYKKFNNFWTSLDR